MNIGVIGFGLMGQQRARDISQMRRHKLIAVNDINLDVVKKYQKKFKYQVESTWQGLIKRKDLDVIIIAVPHFLALKIAIAALKAGKNVLCEKPIGRNLKETQRIIKAVHKSKKLFEPGLNYRFYPGIQKIYQLIKKGSIGKITHVRCVLGHGGRPGMEKEWKVDKKLCGGGALLDPGIHAIDLFRFLFGEIKEGMIWRKNYFWKLSIEDNTFLLLKTKLKQTIFAHFSITEWKSLFRLEIFGTNGYCFLEGRSRSYGPQEIRLGKRWFWIDNQKEKKWKFPIEEKSFYEELKAFLNKIEGKENKFLATPKDSLRAMQIIERLYSSKENKIVKF